jgi:hypothetical protein
MFLGKAGGGNKEEESKKQTRPTAGRGRLSDEELLKRREYRSLRDAPPGARKVTLRKPNKPMENPLILGFMLKQGPNKEIYIKEIIPGSECDRLKKAGLMFEGDQITMVSATFGDEMWSVRGYGVGRFMIACSVRQGMLLDLVLEATTDKELAISRDLAQRDMAKRKNEVRLQKMLMNEFEEEKKSDKGPFGGLFR